MHSGGVACNAMLGHATDFGLRQLQSHLWQAAEQLSPDSCGQFPVQNSESFKDHSQIPPACATHRGNCIAVSEISKTIIRFLKNLPLSVATDLTVQMSANAKSNHYLAESYRAGCRTGLGVVSGWVSYRLGVAVQSCVSYRLGVVVQSCVSYPAGCRRAKLRVVVLVVRWQRWHRSLGRRRRRRLLVRWSSFAG